MDYAELKSRVESLRREQATVAQHNRQYFSKKTHSPVERLQPRLLQDRVRLIRAELYALI